MQQQIDADTGQIRQPVAHAGGMVGAYLQHLDQGADAQYRQGGLPDLVGKGLHPAGQQQGKDGAMHPLVGMGEVGIFGDIEGAERAPEHQGKDQQQQETVGSGCHEISFD